MIAPNPNVDIDTQECLDVLSDKTSTPKCDTIDIISFCIEEIIDAVQENSAVIVAVNEAISAVDEETQNEYLSDIEAPGCKNLNDKSDNYNLKKQYDTLHKDVFLDDDENSSNEEILLNKETPPDEKTIDNSSLEKNVDKYNQQFNTNGKQFKCKEVIIFSKDSEKVESKGLPVTLLSVSNSTQPVEGYISKENNIISSDQSNIYQNKNSKMKKLKRNAGGGSRFRLGALFGIGNGNINNDVNTKDSEVATNPRYSSLDLCDSSYSSLEIEKQRDEISNQPFTHSPKYHKSTTSLVKRSASKLSLSGVGGGNAYSCSQARSQHVKNQHNSSYQTLLVPDGSNPSIDTTPVLLAVRKRASSDSKPGLFSYGNPSTTNDDSNYYSSNSSKNVSPCINPKNKNSNFTNKKISDLHHRQQTTTLSSKLGFLKRFNKSLHALHPSQNISQHHGNNHRVEACKDAPNPVKVNYTHKGVYSTLQNQKRGGRIHQVNTITSNSPRRTRTLPAEALSERPLYTSDLKHAESINSSAPPVPRPILPQQKRISSNTSATFNAREHLMFMLRRRRRGGKFSPNDNHDYEDINVNQQLKGNLMNVSTSEQTSSSMSSINSTNDRRRGNNRYQHPNLPTISNVHQLTIRPQVHHSHSLNNNNRRIPAHSSSSTNSVNSTTSSTERNSGRILYAYISFLAQN